MSQRSLTENTQPELTKGERARALTGISFTDNREFPCPNCDMGEMEFFFRREGFDDKGQRLAVVTSITLSCDCDLTSEQFDEAREEAVRREIEFNPFGY